MQKAAEEDIERNDERKKFTEKKYSEGIFIEEKAEQKSLNREKKALVSNPLRKQLICAWKPSKRLEMKRVLFNKEKKFSRVRTNKKINGRKSSSQKENRQDQKNRGLFAEIFYAIKN